MSSEQKRNKILEVLDELQLSSTEVADALNKTGIIPRCYPIMRNFSGFRTGVLRCIFAANGSNHDVHEQVKAVQPGEIPVIFTHNCEEKAIFGELVVKYILNDRKANAVVVHGLMRDIEPLINENLPVWCTGATPIGCVNKPADPFPADKAKELKEKYEGAIVHCDMGGVIAIEKDKFTDSMIEKLYRIKDQEKIWFYCMEELGWDTKKVVCDKAYLSEDINVPNELKSAYENLKKGLQFES